VNQISTDLNVNLLYVYVSAATCNDVTMYANEIQTNKLHGTRLHRSDPIV